MTPETKERLEILRRIAERGKTFASDRPEDSYASNFTDLFQHMLDELDLLRKSMEPVSVFPDCPNCESRSFRLTSKPQEIVDRDGGVYVIEDFRYTICMGCDLEYVTPRQARHNEAQAREARSKLT